MMSRGSLFFVLCMLFFLLLAGSSFSPRLDVPSGALPVPAGVHEPMRVRVTFHSQAASCSDSCRGPPMGLMVFDLQLVPEGVPVWLFSSAVLSVSAVLFLTAVSVIALLLDFMLGVVRVTAWSMLREVVPRARLHAKRGCTCTPNRAWSAVHDILLVIFRVVFSLVVVLPMTTVSLIALLLHTKMGEQNGTWFHARGTRTRRMANTCVFDGLQKSSQLDPRVIRRARRKFQTGRPIRASQIEHIARYCKVIIVVYTSDCTQYAEYGTWAPRIALVKSAAGDHVEFLPQWQWPVKATLINPKDVAHESYGAGGANIPVDRKRGRNEDEEEDSTSPKVSKQTEDASMHGPHGPVPQEDVHQGAMDVDGMYAVCSFIRSPVFVQTNKRVPYLSHTLPYALKLSTSMGSRRLRMYMRPREVTM